MIPTEFYHNCMWGWWIFPLVMIILCFLFLPSANYVMHREKKDRRDEPMHTDGIEHDEKNTDQRREQHVDRGRDHPFDICAHFL